MRRLLLIDGHGMMYRAHFAMVNNPLRNKRGEQTTILYNVPRMIEGLIEHYLPSEVVVCFDGSSDHPNHKSKIFPAYKQHRRRAKDDPVSDAREQVHRQHYYLLSLLHTMGVAYQKHAGREADELISTINAKTEADHVVVVTDDKDMYQCISERTDWVKIPAGSEPITLAIFREKYGIEPIQWPHVQALMGDSSDGYPGVKGIGLKGALRLIQKYGCWTKVMQNSEKESPAMHRKLQTGKMDAFRAFNLAWLSREVPCKIKYPLEACKAGELAAMKGMLL